MINTGIISLIGILAVVIIISIIGLMSRYKKCKSDEILVVYGKTGNNSKSAKIIHGGGTFIWPIIQGYEYMSLKPMQLDCNLQGALSSQKIRVNVPTTITVAISTEEDIRQAAAERLLGLDQKSKNDLITDIVYGQMRLIIADMTIEELNNDREKFVENARTNIDEELRKFGLYLMNINISDIRDAADYIVNLGKEAESKAKNEAAANIAEQDKIGAIKVAEAKKQRETTIAETEKERETSIAETEREKKVRLAETERDREVSIAQAKAQKDANVAEAESEKQSKVAEANSKKEINVAEAEKRAQVGKNLANEEIARSTAKLKVAEAKATQEAEVAKAQAEAEIKRQNEIALAEAEAARAKKVRQSLEAEKIVPAEIAKQEAVLKAEQIAEAAIKSSEGEAKAIERKAEAEAKAIRMKGEAEAAAKSASLQAEVDAYRGKLEAADAHPEIAVQMQIVDKVNYTEIAAEQRKAFEQMKLGNITIYDTGNGGAAGDFMKNIIDKVAPALGVMSSLPLPEKIQNFLKPGPNADTVNSTTTTQVINETKTEKTLDTNTSYANTPGVMNSLPGTNVNTPEPVIFEPVENVQTDTFIDESLKKPFRKRK